MSNSNVYNFDIIFNKKTDFEVFKLSNESEFHQLKLMICGKYKIYDLNKIFIYYNNILLNNNYAENTKLKNIFLNNKKIKIEVLLKKNKPKIISIIFAQIATMEPFIFATNATK